MKSLSLSNFINIHRSAVTSTSLRRAVNRRIDAQRSFGISRRGLVPGSPNATSDTDTQHDVSPGDSIAPSRQHSVDKANERDPNIQSYESHQGTRSRLEDTGGIATRQKDERNSTAEAKKQHPEAPDTIIGMQDERGGKGV